MNRCLVLLFTLIPVLVSAEAGTIESVSFATGEKTFEVSLLGKGKLDCIKMYMDNPPRVALDFPDVKNRLASTIDAEENEYISRIRSSSYTKSGSRITRIMIDLKAPWNYSVETGEGVVRLKLSPPEPQKNVAAPAAGDEKQAAVPDLFIGAEDLLEISVFELPQFSVTARVSGDGTITMPLVGSVEVRGLTKKQAEKKIADALEAKYVNNANVSVYIKEYKSRQVSLLGAVKSPGAYYIISRRTLLQLLSEAGGLTPEAGPKCFIFRPNSPRIEIDLVELLVKGNQDLNVGILPGDVINIPSQTKVVVYVLGAVRNPGAVELSTSMPVTLVAAIAHAGGPSDEANQSEVQIRRKDESGNEIVLKVNFKDILRGKAEDVSVLPGDIINVSESFF